MEGMRAVNKTAHKSNQWLYNLNLDETILENKNLCYAYPYR